jgi:hypothetical protein
MFSESISFLDIFQEKKNSQGTFSTMWDLKPSFLGINDFDPFLGYLAS